MKKNILIGIATFVQLIIVAGWIACFDFRDQFHLRLFDVILQIEDGVHSDTGVPMILIRIFHNKVTQLFFEFIRHISKFWDTSFLVNFLSIIGFFGLLSGIYYLVKKREKTYIWILLGLLLLLQAVSVVIDLRKFFRFELVLLWVFSQIIIVYGLFHYLGQGNKLLRFTLVITLIVLSIWWYFVFKRDIYNYCLKL